MMEYQKSLGSGKKCALLISDMQKAFTQGTFHPNFKPDEQIILINQLIEVAHKKQIPIIYTIIAYNNYELLHPNIWVQKLPYLKELQEKSPITALDSRLPFDLSRDLLITKKHPSSFFGTSLANQLICQGVDTIITTGCNTSGCVRATAVDGMQNGFRMMIVEDAVADPWLDSHQRALYEINAKYGDVIRLEEAKKIMNNL